VHLVAELTLTATPPKNTVLVFLEDAVRLTGLKVICPPEVVEYETQYGEGITGFVLIAESHIAFSCIKLRGDIHIFSCRDFPYKDFEQVIRQHFHPLSLKTYLILRTAGHPDPSTPSTSH